jgi:Transmembrane secretion effector
MTTAGRAVSTWAPLGVGIFRALWMADLVSNIGTWMQTVGAQWLLVHQPHASILVALVQTADMLPDVLFAYVGGVLADTFDRRWLLIIVQGCLVITGLALTLLTIAGQMPPALLLTLTFVLGAGSAFSVPAYQAIIPDLVSRDEIPSASALSSININLGRAVGPAIAGVLITRVGVGAVFALNTVTFLVFGLVVAAWRPRAGTTSPFPERFVPALRAGGRTRRERLWAAAGRAGSRCPCWCIHAPPPARQAVDQCPAACCQPRLRVGAGRACAGAERRSDPGHTYTDRDRVDRRPLEYECRDATLPAYMGARPRSLGLSDGPLRRPGRWCRDLGDHCRAGGTRGDPPHRSGGHGRRDSHNPSLAPLRHEGH